MVVQFSILVSNNDDLMGLGYTRIEVWQSLDQGNSYQEITASTPQAAFVDSFQAQTTFQMGGRLLKFVLDGGIENVVTFSSLTQYWTPQQVVDRINEVTPGVASLNTNGVRLTSPTVGRASSIEITYSDAGDLGFQVGLTFGRANRPPLFPETFVYKFSDVSGSTVARYKWRFSADGSNPITPFSPYVFATGVPLVNTDKLSICSATFVGLDGQPLKTRVVVVADQNPTAVGGLVVTNTAPMVLDSDASGFLQFTLVRGTKVRVAIEGTVFVREITVPDAATFDLLTAMSEAPDPFTVQTVPPFLIRRHI